MEDEALIAEWREAAKAEEVAWNQHHRLQMVATETTLRKARERLRLAENACADAGIELDDME